MSCEMKIYGSVNRREFFRSLGRGAALVGLGTIGSLAVRKTGRNGKLPAQSCLNKGICSSCRAFDGCRLPQALSRKKRKLHRKEG